MSWVHPGTPSTETSAPAENPKPEEQREEKPSWVRRILKPKPATK